MVLAERSGNSMVSRLFAGRRAADLQGRTGVASGAACAPQNAGAVVAAMRSETRPGGESGGTQTMCELLHKIAAQRSPISIATGRGMISKKTSADVRNPRQWRGRSFNRFSTRRTSSG